MPVDEVDFSFLAHSSEVPTDLYMALSPEGTALYIGITSSLGTRMRRHQREDRWWKLAHRVTVRRISIRVEAQREESRLIRKLDPPYNTVHRTLLPPHRPHEWWRRRDEDILLLCLAGWTKWEIRVGMRLSDTSLSSALARLRREGRLSVEPTNGTFQSGTLGESLRASAIALLGHEPRYAVRHRATTAGS